MNWLLIAVGIIFLISIMSGLNQGFLKIIISLTAAAATIVLVIFLTPYTARALYQWTPLDEIIQDKISEAMEPDLEHIDLSGIKIGDLDLGALGSINLGDIDFESLGINKEELKKAISQIEIPKEIQTNLIREAGLPRFIEESLIENNNETTYKELGITKFQDYIGAYVTRIVINIIAFLVTLVFAGIVMRILIYALAIMEKLPVIHGVNRLMGGVLGIGIGLIVVWVLFLIITLTYSSEAGQMCYQWIQESQILKILYDMNPLLKWMTAFW